MWIIWLIFRNQPRQITADEWIEFFLESLFNLFRSYGLKHLLYILHEVVDEDDLLSDVFNLRLILIQESLSNPRKLIGLQKMLKSLNTTIWKQLQEEVTFSMYKRKIPANKIRDLIKLGHEAFNGLLYDVIQWVEELMINGLCFTWKIKLKLILLVQAMCHQRFAHGVSFWYEEESVDVEITTFILFILQDFKIDLLQGFLDCFQDEIASQGKHSFSQIFISTEIYLCFLELCQIGFEEFNGRLDLEEYAYYFSTLVFWHYSIVIRGFNWSIPIVDFQFDFFKVRVVFQIRRNLIWNRRQHVLLIQYR